MALNCYVRISVLMLCSISCINGDLCPKKCDCDMENGLNRATCIDQNIISVDVGVPNGVQMYSVSHNSISELDNFCFKDAGYLSLEVLNLSYNLIFWIGLHAFAGLDKLFHLDLSNNRLRYIPSDLFWDTPKLINLDLSSNIFETLKNEPFIMHTSLQIVNLNNCRIKALPERLFTRLPNLKKLDLSENYVVTLSTQVLAPLRKLQRIELRNDYWTCNVDFMAAETWIISRGITYQKQCRHLAPKMAEKMISLVPIRKEVDVYDVWNITSPPPQTVQVETTTPLTPFEKFDKEFSAFQAFILGVEIGLAIGIVATYIWLRKFCRCGQLTSCLSPQRQQNRIMQRRRDGDMRAGLLWSNVITPDLETPPSSRRQPLSERSQVFATYGVPVAREASLQVDAIRLPNRAETPPPPYHECRINI